MAAPSPLPVAFAIRGPILPDDLDGLCRRAREVLSRTDARVVLCGMGGVGADAVTVDALARLELAARRHGRAIRLCYASEDLRDLLLFVGLSHVLRE